MKKLLFLAAGILLLPQAGTAQTASDSAAIRGAALDYIEGWYTGDAVRMERALHPELAKRILMANSNEPGKHFMHMTADQLVDGARRGGGSNTPADEQRKEVRILDIFRGTASVRVDARTWVDYLHVVQDGDGHWSIINVLWELREDPAPTGDDS
ncbi:MAG: nuclear transport factor 2 family protein [Gemmatimonadota bacterium]